MYSTSLFAHEDVLFPAKIKSEAEVQEDRMRRSTTNEGRITENYLRSLRKDRSNNLQISSIKINNALRKLPPFAADSVDQADVDSF